MEQNGEIIDAQVNYGDTPFGPNCDFETYRQNAESIGITQAIIVPTPTHIRETEEGTEISCLWREGKADISERYYAEVQHLDGSTEAIDAPRNPYRQFNLSVLEFVRNSNDARNSIRLHFAPKIHPLLDDKDALEELLDEETVCLKIHGIASHSEPDVFPQWLPELARHHDLPLLVHTDFLKPEEQASSPKQATLNELYRRNNPMAYIQWALRHNVRMVINHGARLDPEAIHIVNNEENLIMAYGPDSLLDAEQERLVLQTNDYAKTLFEYADPDKVMFSNDYRWNVADRNAWDDLRWDSVDRIRGLLSPEDQQKVLAGNIRSFYRLQ